MKNQLFSQDLWNIGIVFEPIGAFLITKPEVRWFSRPQRNRFLADPFALMRGKSIHILCEEFDCSTSKGRIVSIEFTQDGFSPPKVAIELPYHISYPYLVESEGEIYCVPETRNAHEISLYKADEFPHRWKKVATLVSDFDGVDGTIFRYDGLWWLTSTDPESRLFVWYSRDLSGPWIPHQLNPVKIDASSSRPGGTPFVSDGVLYRPAQDCSKNYGHRIVLNRIISLTPERFEEERTTVIEPYLEGPYRDGLHTLSAVGSYTLIDGKRTVYAWSALRRTLKGGVARIRHRSAPLDDYVRVGEQSSR
ncbi:MAG: hypothetical protein ABSC50_07300 [Candidatus Bathyarchaeia archaeon]